MSENDGDNAAPGGWGSFGRGYQGLVVLVVAGLATALVRYVANKEPEHTTCSKGYTVTGRVTNALDDTTPPDGLIAKIKNPGSDAVDDNIVDGKFSIDFVRLNSGKHITVLFFQNGVKVGEGDYPIGDGPDERTCTLDLGEKEIRLTLARVESQPKRSEYVQLLGPVNEANREALLAVTKGSLRLPATIRIGVSREPRPIEAGSTMYRLDACRIKVSVNDTPCDVPEFLVERTKPGGASLESVQRHVEESLNKLLAENLSTIAQCIARCG